jgi:hypothetical protein
LTKLSQEIQKGQNKGQKRRNVTSSMISTAFDGLLERQKESENSRQNYRTQLVSNHL